MSRRKIYEWLGSAHTTIAAIKKSAPYPTPEQVEQVKAMPAPPLHFTFSTARLNQLEGNINAIATKLETHDKAQDVQHLAFHTQLTIHRRSPRNTFVRYEPHQTLRPS